VPENTAWDAEAALKLYRQVAEHSLAYWLDGKCGPCGGTGVTEARACKCCSGTGKVELTMAAGFVREHTLNMVSELHNIADSHAARVASRLRP
jgi:RecJ-like exonuclease